MACDGCRVVICVYHKYDDQSRDVGCISFAEIGQKYTDDQEFYCPTCSHKRKIPFEVRSPFLPGEDLFRVDFLLFKLNIRHRKPLPHRGRNADPVILFGLTCKDTSYNLLDFVIGDALALELAPEEDTVNTSPLTNTECCMLIYFLSPI